MECKLVIKLSCKNFYCDGVFNFSFQVKYENFCYTPSFILMIIFFRRSDFSHLPLSFSLSLSLPLNVWPWKKNGKYLINISIFLINYFDARLNHIFVDSIILMTSQVNHSVLARDLCHHSSHHYRQTISSPHSNVGKRFLSVNFVMKGIYVYSFICVKIYFNAGN